jgi:deoxyhypusine synthase
MDASSAVGAVLQPSSFVDEGRDTVEGYDFNKGVNYEEIIKAYKRVGFQSTNLGLAIDEINRMV